MQKETNNEQREAQEWIEWVEKDDPNGSRQKEIYPIIRNWATLIKPHTLADIGTGQGICSTLIDSTVEVVGIDTSKLLLERAQKLYTSSNRRFIEGNAYSIPLPDDSVDAAMSIAVWSHLKDLRRAAKEMQRILSPGGHFLVITANPATYDVRRTFYKEFEEHNGMLVGTFDLGGGKVLSNSTLYFHSLESILEALKQADLQIDTTMTLGKKDTYLDGLYISVSGLKL